MPETTTAATTGTWTEEEIRQQPACWIRSLNNIDSLRSSIDSFLTPLLRKNDLRIVLTGAGTSAFIGDIIAPWLASHTGKNITAVPTTDLVTNPMDYFSPRIRCCWSLLPAPATARKASPPLSWQISSCRSATTCRLPAMRREACTRTRSTAITPLPC
jgi:hypothetical protein